VLIASRQGDRRLPLGTTFGMFGGLADLPSGRVNCGRARKSCPAHSARSRVLVPRPEIGLSDGTPRSRMRFRVNGSAIAGGLDDARARQGSTPLVLDHTREPRESDHLPRGESMSLSAGDAESMRGCRGHQVRAGRRASGPNPGSTRIAPAAGGRCSGPQSPARCPRGTCVRPRYIPPWA